MLSAVLTWASTISRRAARSAVNAVESWRELAQRLDLICVYSALLNWPLINLQAGSAECTPCLSLRSDFMQAQPSGYSCHFPVSAAGATTCCEPFYTRAASWPACS
jgi:hypothetical protein